MKSYRQGSALLIHGDSRAVLPSMPEGKLDACITDPPYALVSIGKRFGKPGAAPAKSDGATGVYARASAGFMGQQWDTGETAFDPAFWAEVLRVLKPGAHLLAFGGTRTFHRLAVAIEDAGFGIRDTLMWVYGSGFPKSHNLDDQWEGWGTALKPAWEPIIMARKPLVGTVAANVLAHGTGALNIDGCRVAGKVTSNPLVRNAAGFRSEGLAGQGETGRGTESEGRWPANVIHDGSEEVVACFPDIKGQQGDVRDDSGSAARFFYCAKASKADREEGLSGLPLKNGGMVSETLGQHITRRDGCTPPKRANNHPTVKPTDLMRYLCRLVTPPGGTILDPFMGSGSTGKAAIQKKFKFVGVESNGDYVEIARGRVK